MQCSARAIEGMDTIIETSTAFEASIAGRPKLFVECTNTYHSSVQSGIQRVVRNILRNAGEVAAQHGYALVPVVYEGGQFRAADLRQVLDDKLQPPEAVPLLRRASLAIRDWRAKPPRLRVLNFALPVYRNGRRMMAVLLPHPAVHRFLFAYPDRFGLGWIVLMPWRALRRIKRLAVPRSAAPDAFQPPPKDDPFGMSLDAIADHRGNVLLMLDGSWHLSPWGAIERFQSAGGKTEAMIYDLIPLTHPEAFIPSLRDAFARWITEHLRVSRHFVTISHTVAGELDAYLTQVTSGEVGVRPWRVAPFYLGSELDFVDPDLKPSDSVRAVFDAPEHVFIVVGSIEPRKNHSYILDAFDQLWAQGGTARLVIIGRHGWRNEDVMARMAEHPLAGSRLFLQRDMSDSDLDYAYRQASALVIASQAEGFGLPVVEAFQRGLPVLCSDIPVFREIADGRAAFFSLADPARLTEAVAAFCEGHDVASRGLRLEQPWLTWRQSTEQLLDIVLGPAVTPI